MPGLVFEKVWKDYLCFTYTISAAHASGEPMKSLDGVTDELRFFSHPPHVVEKKFQDPRCGDNNEQE